MSTKQVDDLKARLEAAESDSRLKSDTAAKCRIDLIQHFRPKYVAGFLEVIQESDSLMMMHLQRYGQFRNDDIISITNN